VNGTLTGCGGGVTTALNNLSKGCPQAPQNLGFTPEYSFLKPQVQYKLLIFNFPLFS